MILVAHVVLSTALAFMFTPLFTSALGSVEPRLYSHGSAIVGTVQQVAGAAGTALFITVMTARTATETAAGATALAAEAAGIRTAFLVGAILSISAVVGAFFVRRPADMMQGAPGGPLIRQTASARHPCEANSRGPGVAPGPSVVRARSRQPQFGRQVRCESASTSTMPRSSGFEAEYAAPLVTWAICCIAGTSVSGPKPIMITGTGLVGSSIFLSSASSVVERDAVLILVLAVGDEQHGVDLLGVVALAHALHGSEGRVVEAGGAAEPVGERLDDAGDLLLVREVGERRDRREVLVVEVAVARRREDPHAELDLARELLHGADRGLLEDVDATQAALGRFLHRARDVDDREHARTQREHAPGAQDLELRSAVERRLGRRAPRRPRPRDRACRCRRGPGNRRRRAPRCRRESPLRRSSSSSAFVLAPSALRLGRLASSSTTRPRAARTNG